MKEHCSAELAALFRKLFYVGPDVLVWASGAKRAPVGIFLWGEKSTSRIPHATKGSLPRL